MEKPSKTDMQEFLNTNENAPKTVQLTKEAQESVLAAIRNSSVSTIVPTAEEPTKKRVKMEAAEWCAHCDVTDKYSTYEDEMTVVCKNCGKTIVLCGKCASNGDDCGTCIYCDLANFYNYLRGKNTLEQFLSALNPTLTDMTTASDDLKDKVLTYDDFVYDTYGDKVTWDVKYWEIVGLVRNSMLNGQSPESEVLPFLKDIVERNKK